MNKDEEILMQLIIKGGNGRSSAMKAIFAARAGDFEKSELFMKECELDLTEAHNFQTKLIQSEAAGESINISLLTIHAQDHLMNALTVKDLAKEIIALHKK
ncbi:MAG: PTS lactose/cellobiose transporter subunit IIA [Lactovum sp.]